MHIEDEFEKLTLLYPVLAKLSSGLRNALVKSGYPLQAGPDRILFDADEKIETFLLLSKGTVRVVLPGKERDLLLYRVGPGDSCIISICHLLGDTRYRVRAQVETTISGIALPHTLFHDLVRQSACFNNFIYHVIAERMTNLLNLLEAVTSLRLDERLAELLVSKGTLIRITHSQLADELGSVREVISRILKDFEGKGLLKLERGIIRIIDQESLINMYKERDSGH